MHGKKTDVKRRREGRALRMQKSIKLHVKYSRNVLYVHGSFASRLQSTTMTIVSEFLKYAVKKVFSLLVENVENMKG